VAENATPVAADASPGGLPTMSKTRVIWLALGLTVTMLLALFDQNIVVTAAYPIVSDLDPANGLTLLPWLVTAYVLAATAVMPLYGRLIDIFGPKRLYLFAVGAFLAGSALCGIAQNLGELIAFRAIQGIGGGGLQAATMVIMTFLAPPKKRAAAGGAGGAVVALGLVLGPTLGGFLTDHFTWRAIFYVNVPLGVFAITVVALLLRIPAAHSRGRIDILGAGLVAAAASGLLLVSDWGGTRYAWDSPVMISMIVGVVVLTALFVWRQLVASEPIFPFVLFRDVVFRVASPLQFITGFAFAGPIVYLMVYAQAVRGWDPTSAGGLMLPLAVGIAVSNVVTSVLITKWGRYKVFLVLGFAIVTAATFLLGTLAVDTPAVTITLYMLMLGVGVGQTMQIVLLAVQNSVPARYAGVSITSTRFSQQLGVALGATIFGVILNREFAAHLPAGAGAAGASPTSGAISSLPPGTRDAVLNALVTGIDWVFFVAAGILTVGVVLSLLLKEKPLSDELPDDERETLEPEIVTG
jgi:EmrB/QacA subfamily drug resistance transporter